MSNGLKKDQRIAHNGPAVTPEDLSLGQKPLLRQNDRTISSGEEEKDCIVKREAMRRSRGKE